MVGNSQEGILYGRENEWLTLLLRRTIWVNLINIMLNRNSWAKIESTTRSHLYKVQMQVHDIYGVRSGSDD